MASKVFAAIYIGSYELSLKIYEFNSKKKMREIDHVRSRIDLGRDIYNTGAVGYESVEQLCNLLSEYQRIIKGYRADNYEVYASVVFHEATNELFVLNQIQIRTGIKAKVLSNSEHRFITYETIAESPWFEDEIKRNAAIVDIGGSGIQITLFEKGEIVTTQHMDLGTIRLRNMLRDNGESMEHYQNQLEEFILKKLEVYRSMYLKQDIEYLILVNDNAQRIKQMMEKHIERDNTVGKERFLKTITKLFHKNSFEQEDPFLVPALILFKCLVKALGSENITIPESDICDGIAYDYACKKNLIHVTHDFEEDVLSACHNLAEHYNSYTPHIEALGQLSVQIFDAMKKVHGLNKRHLLLLRAATILHDVGKFISISNASISAYHIIMESEIIGLTHLERNIVAYTVLFNSNPLLSIEELPDAIDQESYIAVAKLSAILRVANALDQSHKQKFGNVKITLKDRELVITLEAEKDIGLEKALFSNKTNYFENVFSIKPVLKEKRVYQLNLDD